MTRRPTACDAPLMAASPFDVIVLDLMLPGEDGLSLMRWVQRTLGDAGLLLTAHGDPISRVVGLELGADDYLGKPFEPRELVARIQAVLRRVRKGREHEDAGRMVRFAGWRFDRLARQLISPDDVAMPLSNAEFRLLTAFVAAARARAVT